jgi:hypothetical protein
MRSQTVQSAHPNGHFYSPVVDPAELQTRLAEIYPETPTALGIDFEEANHLHLIENALRRFMPEFDYPELGPEDGSLDHFYIRNSQFSWLDCRALFCLLRFWQPKRVVEVGSGYSSLLMSDVKRRFLPNLTLQCIEPYPRPFLLRDDFGIELFQQRVQEIPPAFFESLEAGDLLFIDSSHVCKTGSDVNYLFLQILPRLRSGVRIHVHDVFLPFEYLKEWVIDENRSWNEQYILQALLMHSKAFKVSFANYFVNWKFPDAIRKVLNHPRGMHYGGGSFYFERC